MDVTEKDSKLPKISIGMPVYNGEKYIKEAIESILNQTFQDFEVVISDNCSVDNTQEICEKYVSLDPRIKYVRQSKNIGANLNFKFLLTYARADYFMWLAHDDMMGDSNYLNKMYTKIVEGYDFCFANTKFLSENGLVDRKVFGRFEKCVTKFDFCRETTYICSYQFYGLFRRLFLTENYKYVDICSHMKCYGEGLIVHAMTLKSTPSYVPDVSLIYRRHDQNISSMSNGKHYRDFFEFTFHLIRMYTSSKDFTFREKAILLKNILVLHSRHLLVLTFPQLSLLKR